MKLNRWTVVLAAMGVVNAAAIACADEQPVIVTGLPVTSLSGYVDTSAQWNLGQGDAHAPAYKYGGASKADGFNLNAVDIAIEKALPDEMDWLPGYKVDLFLGPDAKALENFTAGTSATDFSVKQAYVLMRVPVGTGLTFKMGVFDSIIGHESTDSVNNPNFTYSWGHTFEPSEHTGILGSYRFNDVLAISAGVANTLTPGINARAASGNSSIVANSFNESYKTYLAAVALTAPNQWGYLAGSTLYGGLVNGFAGANAFGVQGGGGASGAPAQSYYIGATVNTPLNGLRVGFAFDYFRFESLLTGGFPSAGAHSFAGYASYQATERLSLHGRLEYADVSANVADLAEANGLGLASRTFSATATVQYDLWKDVMSRIEFRWDHALDGTDAFGGTSVTPISRSGHVFDGTARNSYIVVVNLVYKF